MDKREWYWCPYHQEILLLLTDEEYEERIKIIKQTKPSNEVPIRLANFLRVKGNLPEDVIKTYHVYNKAWDVYNKARDVYHKAIKSNISAIRALYEKEVPKKDQAWDWDIMQLNFKK